jgi:uncharacterized delta-60 repeat protein
MKYLFARRRSNSEKGRAGCVSRHVVTMLYAAASRQLRATPFITLLATALFLLSAMNAARAQSKAAEIDSTFYLGTGPSGFIRTMALQPDGKILLGGAFASFSGYYQSNYTRLYPEGSVDSTFNYGIGANSMVNSIVVETNGNILLAGNFTTVNYSNRARIARLDTNGTVDTTLAAASLNAACYAAIGLQYGKVVVGGSFGTPPKSGLLRLLLSGNPDVSFDPGLGITNGAVYAMALDGTQVMVGGSFTVFDVVARSHIARINADGQVDLNYVPPAIDGVVYAMALQPDRKLLIAGDFEYINGEPHNRIARLNADGSLDTTFTSPAMTNGAVFALAFQSDGKILAAGSFTNINGLTRNRLARFGANGGLDLNFDPGVGANHAIYALAIQSDGKILIAGTFTTVNGFSYNGVARLKGTPKITLTTSYNVPADELAVSWTYVEGTSYTLEYSEDLVNWYPVDGYDGYSGGYTEYDVKTLSQRFYRVSSNP